MKKVRVKLGGRLKEYVFDVDGEKILGLFNADDEEGPQKLAEYLAKTRNLEVVKFHEVGVGG